MQGELDTFRVSMCFWEASCLDEVVVSIIRVFFVTS